MKIGDIRHPEYDIFFNDWEKWRLTYRGGQAFLEKYLEKFSLREDGDEFLARKRVTPIPTFAKAAVNDVKNAIFQRLIDISRTGGPVNYLESCKGNLGGVDRKNGSMNFFIGDKILPELLTMKRVGTYVDSPPLISGESAASRLQKHPYLYSYAVEDILSWAFTYKNNAKTYLALLLRDRSFEIDSITRLPIKEKERFRHLWIGDDQKVHVQFYNVNSEKDGDEQILNIPEIPFVDSEITESLLADASNYQIALMNMESSDVMFALKSLFPFYTEQSSGLSDGYLKQPVQDDARCQTDGVFVGSIQTGPEIRVGVTQGRRYPMGAERPQFIAPPTEPIAASMEKQDRLKEDIRLLVNLALSNVKPKMASAESKAMDQTGLESGLSYIGLELEQMERGIARIWAMYESSEEIPTVKYPGRYSLKSDEEERKEAQDLKAEIYTVPSKVYSKEILKRIASILIGSKVTSGRLEEIFQEIDNADYLTGDPLVLIPQLEAGLVGEELASAASGFPKAEIENARKDHAARLARIQLAQTSNDPAARGNPSASVDPAASSKEKIDKPTRGPNQ
jgi:hypothetical protein